MAYPRDPSRGFPPSRQAPVPVTSPQPVVTASRPPGPPGGPGRPRRRRRAPRRLILVVIGALILAGLGTAGYTYLHRNQSLADSLGALQLPTGPASSPSSKLGTWKHITHNTQDPAPLTISELYPPAFGLRGLQFQRVTAKVDKTCGKAVFGALLQADLQSGHCTQVVRATYLSGDQKIMGTIGVANVSSIYWSLKGAKTTSGKEDLITPLTGSKGPAKNMLKGSGIAYATVKGHYLILTYSEFTNLKTPKSSSQRAQLVAFAKDLIDGSANISLSTRMLTGKP